MTASISWPNTLPQHFQAQSARMQPGPQLVDRYEAATPIYFLRSRAKTRRISGSLRLTFVQRDFWLGLEPSLRGRRFNADFERLGSTRETIIDDWSISAATQGTTFILALTLTVFDSGIAPVSIYPDTGIISSTGNTPTLTTS